MKNVISIASACPDVQTGFIASHIAKYIAKTNPEKRILFVSLEYGPDPYKTITEKVFPLGEIPVILDRYTKNLHSFYAKGNIDLQNITPDIAEQIIKCLAERYDAVICDCEGQLENGFALGCLFRSDNSYYVSNHTKKSIERFAWIKPLLDKLGIHVDSHIVDFTSGNIEYTSDEFLKCTENGPFYITFLDDERMLEDLYYFAKRIGAEMWTKEPKEVEFGER